MEAALGPIRGSDIPLAVLSLSAVGRRNPSMSEFQTDPMECESIREIIRSCMGREDQQEKVSSRMCSNGAFMALPYDVIYMILAYLGNKDLRAFIKAHDLRLRLPASFWKAILPPESFVEIEDYPQNQIDFQALYFMFWGLTKDRRAPKGRTSIVARLQTIRNSYLWSLEDGRGRRKASSYIADWDVCHKWRGAHRFHNIIQKVSLPKRISEVRLYFHREEARNQEDDEFEQQEKDRAFVLSGIVMLPGPHALGHYLNENDNPASQQTCLTVDVKRELRGMLVLIDNFGIRQIKLLYPGRQSSRWLCPDKPVTMTSNDNYRRFTDQTATERPIEPAVGMVYYKDSDEQDVTLCAMMDVSVKSLLSPLSRHDRLTAFLLTRHQETKITAIGSINLSTRLTSSQHCSQGLTCQEQEQDQGQPHECLRTTRLWRPNLPPADLNLNDSQFIHSPQNARLYPELQSPGNHLQYILFYQDRRSGKKKKRREELARLTEILNFNGFPCSIKLTPSKSKDRRTINYSSKALQPCEYFTQVLVQRTISTSRTKIVLQTNVDRTLTAGRLARGRPEEIQKLVAPEGEEVVGVYWDRWFEVGIISSVVRMGEEEDESDFGLGTELETGTGTGPGTGTEVEVETETETMVRKTRSGKGRLQCS
jgi:hypothetical protein